MIIKRKPILILLLFLSSCLDSYFEDTKQVYNNIYLMKVGGRSYTYDLYLKTGEHTSRPILFENIHTILGNDTVIYVLSVRNEPDTNYYKIFHNNGDTIQSITPILQEDYHNLTSGNNFQITYKYK